MSKVPIVQLPGGTFSEASIARSGPHAGDLRRPGTGGRRRADGGGDVGVPPGPGGAGRHHGPFHRPCWWFSSRPQGLDPGARHGRRGQPHRPRRPLAFGSDRQGTWAPGHGPFDAWDFPARVQFRPRPPVGRRHFRELAPGVGAWHRPGQLAPGGGRRLHHLRGLRQGQVRCRLRLHQGARLPPHLGRAGGHGRGPARPYAQRLGQHLPGCQAFRGGAGGPRPSGRGGR
jgi:hypothetical protein